MLNVKVALAFGFCSLLWGLTYLLYAVLLRYFPPLFISMFRCMSGALCLSVQNIFLCWWVPGYWRNIQRLFNAEARRKGITRKVVKNMALMAFCTDICGNGALIIGQQQVPSGIASVILTMEPLMAQLFAHVLLPKTPENRMNVYNLVGLLLGMGGTALAVYPTMGSGGEGGDHKEEESSIVYTLIVIWSAIAFGMTAVLGQMGAGGGGHGESGKIESDGGKMEGDKEAIRLIGTKQKQYNDTGSAANVPSSRAIEGAGGAVEGGENAEEEGEPEVPPSLRVTGQFVFSSIYWIPLVIFFTEIDFFDKYPKGYSVMINQPAEAYLYVAISGIFTTSMCVYLYYYMLLHIGSRTALTGFTIPVIGLTSGALLNHEWDNLKGGQIAMEICGMVVVLLGTALAMYKPSVGIVPVDDDPIVSEEGHDRERLRGSEIRPGMGEKSGLASKAVTRGSRRSSFADAPGLENLNRSFRVRPQGH